MALEGALQKNGKDYYLEAWKNFDNLTDMRLKVQVAELGATWLIKRESAKNLYYDTLIDEMRKHPADPKLKDCLKHSEFRNALADRIVKRSQMGKDNEKHMDLVGLMKVDNLLVQSLKTATSRLGAGTFFQKMGLNIGGTESYKTLNRELEKQKKAPTEVVENRAGMSKR